MAPRVQLGALVRRAKQSLNRLQPDSNIGLAPHSLRAVAPSDLPALLHLTDGPIHMHLAEQLAEVDEVHTALGQRPVEWVL